MRLKSWHLPKRQWGSSVIIPTYKGELRGTVHFIDLLKMTGLEVMKSGLECRQCGSATSCAYLIMFPFQLIHLGFVCTYDKGSLSLLISNIWAENYEGKRRKKVCNFPVVQETDLVKSHIGHQITGMGTVCLKPIRTWRWECLVKAQWIRMQAVLLEPNSNRSFGCDQLLSLARAMDLASLSSSFCFGKMVILTSISED